MQNKPQSDVHGRLEALDSRGDLPATSLGQTRTAKTPAERARAYRARKRAATLPAVLPPSPAEVIAVTPLVAPAVTMGIMLPLRRSAASYALISAAVVLAVVGITINGWFARSLGSTEIAGWLFLAVGVAADLVALAAPSHAVRLWRTGHLGTALAGWAVFLITLTFAVFNSIGFASVNIVDVTTERASRVTPAFTVKQEALVDARAARDRECRNGIGRVCREREAAVNERRQELDAVMLAVGQTADPQTEAAIRIVAWATHGAIHPNGNDFVMLRLVLMSMLPQIGSLADFLMSPTEANSVDWIITTPPSSWPKTLSSRR
jgi:hypothetical protein